ncbi:hypothetical protein SAMN05877753_10121 [Bacillus oleivorans]|uniref:Uncharacterized protein n=1 Tax=Bacillus oleivorans TaxID=1448271 RepID=A0A285CGS2_9BACI|nr:hypothetical protein [Bacillus oleivorans]SNX66710.1 hypothetical protein SAMN05877753_10121 [Bacillus oleivorans]
MKQLKIKKGIMGAAVVLLLIGGSVGGTVLAFQDDIVKKNVLMAENTEINQSKGKSFETVDTNNSTPVSEEQAIQIAKAALKDVFEAEINDDEYLQQTEYYDESKNEQSYPGKSLWTVSWKKKQIDPTTDNAIDFSSAFIDAETGEVLSMSSHKSTDQEADQPLTNEEAETMVADFVEAKNLNNGAVIESVEAFTSAKNMIEVNVNLDNGNRISVVISSLTNKISALRNHLEQ